MACPFSIGNFPNMKNIFLFVFVILINLFEIDSRGTGGLMFGYHGKTYSFDTETCEGGIFFKEPIALDYVCPNGYFLQRSSGCSAEGEIIVGAEHYVCTEYMKHTVKVQALIPITNADKPTEHTVTLYDDKDMLTGYRRYTMESAVRKKYIPRENGSSYVLVTNPHNTPDMSIGRLCYSGISQAQGSAYKVEVESESDFSDGEPYGFFSKGCKESSIKVQLASGSRFGIKDGTPDSKRFSSSIAAHVINLEDDADSMIATNRVTKDNHGGEKVFLDLKSNEEDDTDVSKDVGEDEESTTNPPEPDEDVTLTTSEDPSDATTDLNMDSTTDSTTDETTTEMPDTGIPLEDSELKIDVIIDPDKSDLSTYFLELLQMAIMYVEELSGEVDDDGEPIDSNDPSFLDRNSSNDTISDYIWFQILNASVQVVKKIAPSTFPGEIESEFLRAFGYMFRELQDDLNKPDDPTQEFILNSLGKCASAASTMKTPEYIFFDDRCPNELKSVSVIGWLWKPNIEESRNKTVITVDNIEIPDWALNRERFFQPTLHQFVEMMFIAFDIASTYCYLDFKENFNAYSRMSYYMMQTVFSNENVQKHWYSDPLDQSIFLSMVPSYDGYGYKSFHGKNSPTRELDVIRLLIKLRSVPFAWINRSKVEYTTRLSTSTPTRGRDNPTTYINDHPKNTLTKSFAVSDRDILPPPRRRTRINKNSLHRTRSSHPGGKMEWLKRKRRNVPSSDLKGREIWNGLAYCLSMRQVQNSEGQIKQLGLEPSLETLKSEAVC